MVQEAEIQYLPALYTAKLICPHFQQATVHPSPVKIDRHIGDLLALYKGEQKVIDPLITSIPHLWYDFKSLFTALLNNTLAGLSHSLIDTHVHVKGDFDGLNAKVPQFR